MKIFEQHSWWGWFKTRVLRIQPYDCNMQGIIDYLESRGFGDAARELMSLRDQYAALRRER